MIKRINKACRYFPCHRHLEDCTFCYCPFYPCGDEKLGQNVWSARLRKNVWSCKDCERIHKKKITDRIFRLIRARGSEAKGETAAAMARRQNRKNQDTGVIVLGHGSRRREANTLLPKIIPKLKKMLRREKIIPAYLQLAKPSLSQSIKKLEKTGCTSIIVMPFFLFDGNHVTGDIPAILAAEKTKHAHISFTMTKNLGSDRRIIDIVTDKIKECMDEHYP